MELISSLSIIKILSLHPWYSPEICELGEADELSSSGNIPAFECFLILQLRNQNFEP